MTATTVAPDVPALVVTDVSVHFAGLKALDTVSFTVAPGSVHAVIGPNGAGKSTTFNVLSGIYQATSGSVRFGDHELTTMRPHKIARLGVARAVPEHRAVQGPDRRREPHARPARADPGRLRELRACGWPSATARAGGTASGSARSPTSSASATSSTARPGLLSYGDQKRVEVARALACEPRLLLLDEPVAGMNSDEKARMAGLIAEVRRELGISILLVEHDMGLVMGISDRVTVLDFGKRIADGTPGEVQNDPEVVKAYLGTGEDEDA